LDFQNVNENCHRPLENLAATWAHFSAQESGPGFGTIFLARNRDQFSGHDSGPFSEPRICKKSYKTFGKVIENCSRPFEKRSSNQDRFSAQESVLFFGPEF